MIVPSLSFLALLLFFLWWFFHIGFDKRWRRRFLVFQLFDPKKGNTQQFLCLLECFTQFLVFLPQLGRFFFSHRLSLSERSSLNNIHKRTFPHRFCKFEREPESAFQALLVRETAGRLLALAFVVALAQSAPG